MKDGDGSFVLRYAGDYPPLSDTLIHVRPRGVENRIAYKVECPFCNTEAVFPLIRWFGSSWKSCSET